MKKFTEHIQEFIAPKNTQVVETSPVNPGNSLDRKVGLGITNLYAPPQNVIVYLNNILCSSLGILCELGSDNTTIKLSSTKFSSEQNVNDLIYNQIDLGNQRIAIYDVLRDNGYNNIKVIKVGNGIFYVYATPPAVATVDPNIPAEDTCNYNIKDCCGCPDKCESLIESEVLYLNNDMINEASDDDEDVTESGVDEIIKILYKRDKVKAARELSNKILKYFTLPREYYFGCVKPKEGKENIALRWKYIKRRPPVTIKNDNRSEKDKTSYEMTRSLMNFIFDDDDKFIWIQDFEKDSMFVLPKETRRLIENILDLLDAEETDDPCVWKLPEEEKEDKEDKKEEKEDKEDKEDKKEKSEKPKNSDDDDEYEEDSEELDDNKKY